MLPAKLKLVRVTSVYILTILTLNGKSMAVDSADCSRGTKTGGLKRLTGELVCSEPSPPLVPLGSLCTLRRGSLCLRTHQTSSGSFLGGKRIVNGDEEERCSDNRPNVIILAVHEQSTVAMPKQANFRHDRTNPKQALQKKIPH